MGASRVSASNACSGVALARRQLGRVDLHEPDAAVVGEPSVSPSVTLATMPEASTFAPLGSSLGADSVFAKRAPDEEDGGPDGDQDSWQPRAHVQRSFRRPSQDALVTDATG